MKAFVFDVDDTLYDQTQPFVRAYKELMDGKYDVDMEQIFVHSRHYSNVIYGRFMNGECTLDEVGTYRIVKAYEDFGIRIPDEEGLEFQHRYYYYQHHIILSEQMKKLLSDMKDRAVLGVITNGPSVHQWQKLEALELEKWISKEHLIVSGDYAVHKPDVRLFQIAQERLGTEKEQLYFIGDSMENDMVGAKNAGWKTIWINRRNYEYPEEEKFVDHMVKSEEELYNLLQKLC